MSLSTWGTSRLTLSSGFGKMGIEKKECGHGLERPVRRGVHPDSQNHRFTSWCNIHHSRRSLASCGWPGRGYAGVRSQCITDDQNRFDSTRWRRAAYKYDHDRYSLRHRIPKPHIHYGDLTILPTFRWVQIEYLPNRLFDHSVLGIKIHVWRVALVGHGIEALLDSSHGHVCSFEADTNSDINNINIRANFFARSIRVMSLGATHLSCTQIFDWTKSTSSVHCKADIITEGQIVSPCHPFLHLCAPCVPLYRLFRFSFRMNSVYFQTIDSWSVHIKSWCFTHS